jgi:hypothetical protein
MITDDEAEKLREENKKLKKELEKIKKEFEEYKSVYPSTPTIPPFIKQEIKNNQAKQPGQKKFHKGYARHIPERIDRIKELIPKRCPLCSTKLLGETQEIRSRHVTDIKLTSKVEATRFDIHRKYCTKCKKLVEANAPNALPYARFGLNLMLLVMYLRLGLRLPCSKICSYFSDMFSLKISEGEVIVILKQLSAAFGDYYAHLEKIVRLARVKYSDTTSWRISGKNYAAWVFIACGTVLYKIRKSSCHKVGLAFLKKQKDKILVVDRHSAYRTLARKSGFLLQLCWSHILQDTKGLAEKFGSEGKYIHSKLKIIYSSAKALNHKGNNEIIEQLRAEVFQLTLRHYRHITVWRFVNNLYYRDGNDLFRFVKDAEIDPTNNISERELRALVIFRKITHGSRSRRGANATAMLLSVVQTLRLRREKLLEGLQQILKSASGC